MSIAETYVSAGSVVGIGKQRYMSPVTGGVYGSAYDSTRSGCPSAQPPSKFFCGGRSAMFPCGAPLSTHLAIVSISSLPRTRASANSPHDGVAFHGGIWCVWVMYLMASACGAASAYVINENGAISPG